MTMRCQAPSSEEVNQAKTIANKSILIYYTSPAGEELPSDLEMGSDSNSGDNQEDDGDDGEWNMMGAALEREFLGLED